MRCGVPTVLHHHETGALGSMLESLTIKRFKSFHEQRIPLGQTIVFAGPNNSGKTTALQALTLWDFARKRWWDVKGQESKAKKRVGVPIPRSDLITPPLNDLKSLWNNGKVYDGPNKPSMVQILVEGRSLKTDKPWKYGVEVQFSTNEQFFVRPMREDTSSDGNKRMVEPPDEIREFDIFYLPPLAGIQQIETKLTKGTQNWRIGEGRAGDVLRNLLYTIFSEDEDGWDELRKIIREMFQVEIYDPILDSKGQLFIYYSGDETNTGKNSLEISCGGSGFLQALLLFGFIFARPGNVILIDEPDAHFEVVRQREIYSRIKELIASRNAQLIISTHSEVILDETDFHDIIVFPIGGVLCKKQDYSHFRKTLTKIRSQDLLTAQTKKRILFLEDYTDHMVLKSWSRVLKSPLYELLPNVMIHYIKGSNPKISREHFNAIKQVCPDLRGFALFDRVDDDPYEGNDYLETMWNRNEIENYLLNVNVLERIVDDMMEKMYAVDRADKNQTSIFRGTVRGILSKYLVESALNNPFDDENYQLTDPKASEKILEPFFRNFCAQQGIYNTMSKKNFYRIADMMEPEEIHPEVKEKINSIYEHLCVK